MSFPATAAVRLLAGYKEPVRLASTANLPLAGLSTIDGVLTERGDRVLVKDQDDATRNGIYTASEGRWYRAPDSNAPRSLQRGMKVFVQEGTQADQEWIIASDEPDIGYDDIEFNLYLSFDIAAVATTAATEAAASAASASASAASAAASAASTTVVYPSRAVMAASVVPATFKSVPVLGYAVAGDCDLICFKRVTSQPRYGGVRSTDRFMPDGSTDSTNGGWWVYVPGPEGVDARAFGVKADWNGSDASATDDTAALQNAISFAGLEFGTGFDTGGGGGGDVLLPSGTIMLSSTLIVHNDVRLLGKGTMSTVLKMKSTFSTSANFIRLGTPGDASAICSSQTKGAAGDLVINGTNASGGVAYFLQKVQPSIYSAGNDTGRTFTVYGTDETGASISVAVAGANAGRADVPDYFRTVTRVAVNGATASTVTVGWQTYASFGCRLEQMQLWSNQSGAATGTAMVYTNNAQHTAGLKNVKIFGGTRMCAHFETGIGGASYFTFDDVETYNVAQPAIKLAYDGLMTRVRNVVCAGNLAITGSGGIGIQIENGFFYGDNIHIEGIATGIYVKTPTANNGYTSLKSVLGGAGMTTLITLDAAVDQNTVLLEGIYPNGATNTVNDLPGATTISGNILAPTVT